MKSNSGTPTRYCKSSAVFLIAISRASHDASVVTRRPATDRVVIRNINWKTYERLIEDLENCSSPRLAFDQGVLEIMSPHLEHEEANRTMAAIVEIALEELNINFRN